MAIHPLRLMLEKYQVVIYLGAIAAAAALGGLWPQAAQATQPLLLPVLALLLYVTFTQVPLVHLPKAFREFRFLAAVVIGNFIAIPPLTYLLLQLLPDQQELLLGVALVLLVPCTDWFITFTQLGGGDTRSAIAFTPLSLLLQLATLPFFLLVFLGSDFTGVLLGRSMLQALLWLILLPLFAAFVTQQWAGGHRNRQRVLQALGWLPVPLLAVVVFLIGAGQMATLLGSPIPLGLVTLVYVLFLAVALLLAWLLARAFRLPAEQGRTLAFSFGTRNSFVVLPIALALPAGFETAVVVIVYQSLIELLGMVLFVWLVPNHVFSYSQ